MKTNTILKAFSVALLLSSAIPAFGMNYFRRMTQSVRPALTMRPAVSLRSQMAARMARSFVPRAQVTMPKMAVRPAAVQTCTPTVASSGSWYNWFKKPFVAVASFLGFAVATTSQPALAQQAEDEKLEETAQKCLKRALKDKAINSAMKNLDEQQWQAVKLNNVDPYIFDQCYIDQDGGNQCAQLRERTLSLLEAERMKLLLSVSEEEQKRMLELAALKEKRQQELVERERQDIAETSAEIWKTLAKGFKDSQGQKVSISTIPEEVLGKAIDAVAVKKCTEPNNNVCAEAKKRAAKAIADYRKALATPRVQQQSVSETTQEPKNDSV